ncbi:MAG: hypothetical protein AMS20_12440 [Gemmatimonas sp. SG8_28]|nr:MAG: hypothetical protein AMS20_12440 [Gemmatimonas sp. SG8_28]
MLVDADGMPVEVRQTTETHGTDGTSHTDARPAATASPTAGRPSAPLSAGRVADILEVWRIDDEWWRTPITRRYVDVVLEGGAHVVLFEDLHTGAWFVQQP